MAATASRARGYCSVLTILLVLLFALLGSATVARIGVLSVRASTSAAATSNQVDVFIRGLDNGLWHRRWTGTQWSSWEALGGVLTSDPASVAWAASRLDVFARGADNGLWHIAWDGTRWSGWEPLGGLLTSGVSVTSRAPNELDVMVRGGDQGLWHTWWDGTRWSGWQSLGGTLASDPTSVSWDVNRLDVFVRGLDGGLWHMGWNGTVWQGWEGLGGVLTSNPAPASTGPNRLDVYVRGANFSLWHMWWDGIRWSAWQELGGVLASNPTVVSTGPDPLDVYVRGSDSGLWHTSWDGTRWSGWQSLGGGLRSDPQVVASAGGRLDVLATGNDAALWDDTFTGRWSGWASLGGLSSSAPSGTSTGTTTANDALLLKIVNLIPDVTYARQVYELSCEAAALQMALSHEGIAVDQTQVLNAERIDWRAGYYSRGVLRWGDANLNFVGDPNGSEVALTGYGTYQPNLTRVAAGYGAGILQAGSRIGPAAVYAAVLQGHPVVAWVAFDWRYHAPGSYQAFDGSWLLWAGPIEHAVTIVGVDGDSLLIDNPWSGPQWLAKSTFEAAYATYGNAALVIR